MADTYKDVKTYTYDDGCVVRVHIPELTEEERERRMNNIKRAAVNLMIDKENKDREKKSKGA